MQTYEIVNKNLIGKRYTLVFVPALADDLLGIASCLLSQCLPRSLVFITFEYDLTIVNPKT